MASPSKSKPERRAGTTRRRTLATAAIVMIGMGLLIAHAFCYADFFTDDAYISLRYSERFLAGDGLTWTDGERVEGYSNLLWVLGCALLGAFGVELTMAARVLGFVGTLSAVVAAGYAFRSSRESSVLPALGAVAIMVVAAPLAVWSMGGLEQALMAGLVAWATVAGIKALESDGTSARVGVAAGVLFGLLCWTRPDAPLFCVCAVVVIAGSHGLRQGRWRTAACIAGIAAAFVLAQLGFRLVYYGDWLPNTAYAKVAVSDKRFSDGLEYVRGSFIALGGAMVPAVAALAVTWRDPAARRRVGLCLVPLLGWCLYLVVIGGDFFAGRRQMVPVVVLAAMSAGQLWSASQRSKLQGLRWGAWAFALCTWVWLAMAQTPEEAQNARAIEYKWPRHGVGTGRLISDAFGESDPLLAVEAAGSLPYHARTPALDMLGLNDRHLAHSRPDDIGQGVLGHELGDGAYVASREPDLVVFCNAKGRRNPCYRGARELVGLPEFRRHYKLVHFRTAKPEPVSARIWLRMDSPKVGIQREDGFVRVPGHLFARKDAKARVDEAGETYVRLAEGAGLTFGSLELPAGRWRAQADPARGTSLKISERSSRRTLADGPEQVTLDVSEGAGRLRVMVRNEGDTVELRGVDFRLVD